MRSSDVAGGPGGAGKKTKRLSGPTREHRLATGQGQLQYDLLRCATWDQESADTRCIRLRNSCTTEQQKCGQLSLVSTAIMAFALPDQHPIATRNGHAQSISSNIDDVPTNCWGYYGRKQRLSRERGYLAVEVGLGLQLGLGLGSGQCQLCTCSHMDVLPINAREN